LNNHETRRQHDRYLLNMLTSVSILFADTTRPRTSQKCYINHFIVGCVLTALYFFILWQKTVCSGLHKSIYIFNKYHTLGTFSKSQKETQLILLAYKYMTLAVLSCYSKKKVMVCKPVLWGKTSPLSEIMQSVVQVISTCGVYGLCCLTALSPLFQLYHGCQFYWWRNPEHQKKTTDLPQVTDKL
jgi:hypothetical protein